MKSENGGNLPPDPLLNEGMDPLPAPACRRCRRPLPGGRLHGNCAACLLDLAGDTEVLDRRGAERIPERIGGYELIAPIAAGGMGVVYRARQEGLGRDIALKLISAGRLVRPEQVQRFYTEARAVARLGHPHIVPVHDAGEDDGRHFLAMPLLEGGTLSDRISGLPPQGTEERLETAARWMSVVARAVHHAHQHGVLHRDIKPANILFDTAGQPHVADFGLARLLDEESGLTRTQALLGTPDYLAPEVARGGAAESTVASDVYGLGAVLYELLSGSPPFSSPTPLETLRRASEERAVPPSRRGPPRDRRPSGTEQRLDLLCLKCLSARPADRYASAAEFADDLDRWLRGDAILARPESLSETLLRHTRRNPYLTLALLAFAAAVATGVAVSLSQARANRLDLYAADLHIASESVTEGDLGFARELLDRHRATAPDFAWRLLRRMAEGDPRTPVDRHPWIVNGVAFSPDGSRLVSASVGSGTVGDALHLTPLSPAGPTRSLGTNGARSLAWFPDGTRFLAAHVDGRIRIWNADEGRVVSEVPGYSAAMSADASTLVTCEGNPFPWGSTPAGPTWLRHPEAGGRTRRLPESRTVAVSRDGSRVAVSDAIAVIHILDGRDGSTIRSLESQGRLWSLEFSPDGRRLVATGWRPEVRLWDLRETSSTPRLLTGHTLSTWKAAFSPDGSRLVTSSSDQTLRWWDAGSGESLGVARGHGGEVWCVAFSPDGRQIASGGKDRNVFRWPSAPPRSDLSLPHRSPLRPVFSEDGRLLVTLPGSGADPGSRIQSLTEPATASAGPHGTPLAIGRNGDWLVQERPGLLAWIPGGIAGATRRILELETVGSTPPNFLQAAVSQDLRHFAAVDAEGGVKVWDTRDGRIRHRTRIPATLVAEASFSADNRWLALAAEEHGAWLVPIGGGEPRQLDRHLDQVRSAVFSPDSRILATASVDATIGLWRVPGLEPVALLKGHRTSVDAVACSPDGRILASLETATGVRLWDMSTFREVATLPMPDAEHWLRFSPDGRHLAVQTASGVRLLSAP